MPDREAAARLYRHSRREAVLVAVVWFLSLVWSVGYCYLRGYQHPPDSWVVRTGLATQPGADDFRQILGLPDWVVAGILIPWLICTAFTVFFCLAIMKDDDLGAEAAEGAGHGH